MLVNLGILEIVVRLLKKNKTLGLSLKIGVPSCKESNNRKTNRLVLCT